MKIFITRPIPDIGVEMLKEKNFEVVVNTAAKDRPATKDEILAGAKGSDALLSVLTDKIDVDVMDAGLPTLKIIANYAVGVDNIDCEAAKKKNIIVTNTPGVLTETVAEHAFALLLSIARRIAESDRFVRTGQYKAWGPELLLGANISGKTLGIVGLGRIGSKVACYAVRGFNMKVIYTDLKANPDFENEFGAVYVNNIDDLLPQCDFVSLHVPLTEENRHLINEERLGKMRKTAYLINTSRGPVVDENALAGVLKEGVIAGAALDVFEFEPQITPALIELDNVIMTPHTASATKETRSKMAEMAAANIIEALEDRTPPNPV